MKKIELISLTPSGTFLYLDNKVYRQGNFQCLRFDSSLFSQYVLKEYLGKQIQCSLSKDFKKIRYHNVGFYEKMIGLNVANLNVEELQLVKFFSIQEKSKIKESALNIHNDKIQSLKAEMIDHSLSNSLLPEFYKSHKSFECSIEVLSALITISFIQQGKTHYLNARMKNIEHFFQLVDQISLGQLLKKGKNIIVGLSGCKFNLAKKMYEIEIIFGEQIEKLVLSSGFGTVSLKNLPFMKPSLFAQYRKLEQTAKSAHLGIFSKPFQILSLVYTKNNLTAVVQQIVQGYIYKLRTKSNQILKIELSKIYTPLQNQPGAFVCRQFARKNLIGKEVNVFLTKDQGLNILGSVVRFVDNKDIETLMIENGCGFVKDQLKGTMFYAKLQNLQKKAKELRKGIHNDKSIGVHFYEDYSLPNSKKQKLTRKNAIQTKQLYLQQVQNGEEAVIQKCIDPSVFIVRIDSHKKVLKVKLDGVSKFLANPRLEQYKNYSAQAQAFIYSNFNQRTVNIDLFDYNPATNVFSCNLEMNKGKERQSLQQILLLKGFVVLQNSFGNQKFIEAQKKAKENGVGCWKGKLGGLVKRGLDELKGQFSGRVSWVEDGQIAYVQPNTCTDQLEKIYQLLNNGQLPAVSAEDLVAGYICAAQYQSELCRARIISINEKNVAVVKFIDWGNKQSIQVAALKKIPDQLQYIPPQSYQIVLDLVAPLKTQDSQHLEKVREYLTQIESECKFVKGGDNLVNVYNGGQHLNSGLVYEGLLKIDFGKVIDQKMRSHFRTEMQKLRKQLIGVWQLEQEQERDEKQEQYLQIEI